MHTLLEWNDTDVNAELSSPYFWLRKYMSVGMELFISNDPIYFNSETYLQDDYSYYRYWDSGVSYSQVWEILQNMLANLESQGQGSLMSNKDIICHEIIKRFSKEKEVESIYIREQDPLKKIIIFITSKKNDNELIERLLGIEFDLQEYFSDYLFDFKYVPLFVSKGDVLPNDYKCFFAR